MLRQICTRRSMMSSRTHLSARRLYTFPVTKSTNTATTTTITHRTKGELGTASFALYLVNQHGQELSPWHHVPLFSQKEDAHVLRYVNEIPLGDRKKMEVNTKRQHNPIMQDIKRGKPRLFSYGDVPFNYGCLPQTWEDPAKGHPDLPDRLLGDNDPVDVVELSGEKLDMGGIYEVRLLGCIALIDEGEIDWKVLAIRADHPEQVRTLKDLQQYDPDAVNRVFHWFRYYKTTDGKPENSFGLNDQAMDEKYARDVVLETHAHWKELMSRGTSCHDRLSIPTLAEQQYIETVSSS